MVFHKYSQQIYDAKKIKCNWVQVKWTALEPCSGLSESDPKLYTNFELYEIEIHKHLESI
jgi:hypothetical protein